MKFQIAAALVLLLALGAVVVLTDGEVAKPQHQAAQPQPAQTAPTSEEKAMSTLKIN